MALTPHRMEATRFDRVASLCNRWAPRSLSALRAHLVDGRTPTEAATEFKMLPQNIIELRRRFLAKEAIALSDETDTTLADFMQQVQPIIHQLRPYGPAIQALREKDYTTEQIVAYLKLRGIVISTADFNEYMEKTRT